jgi:hypothetical protein
MSAAIVLLWVLFIVIVSVGGYYVYQNNEKCTGYYDPEPRCPTNCGYNGGEIQREFIVTSGSCEPHAPKTETCPAQNPCEIRSNCVGYYDPTPTCPTYCGYPGGSIQRTFIVINQPSASGTPCPTPLLTVSCPIQPQCVSNPPPAVVSVPTNPPPAVVSVPTNPPPPVVSVPTNPPPPVISVVPTNEVRVIKNCVWGSNAAYDAGCPSPNEFPGGGTCYKRPLDATMFKRVDPLVTDAETATRCYNERTGEGMSLDGTTGVHNRAQAQSACAAQGDAWRLPSNEDEVGKACGTGYGLDANYVWT